MRKTVSFALLLALAAPFPAQEAKAPSSYDRAIAAGYKAAMLCSGIFNAQAMGAKRSSASIEANELAGIYDDYDTFVRTLPAAIGRDRVSVRYDAKMPPRVAVSARDDGCVVLPIGADPKLAVDFTVAADHRRAAGWPRGDADPVRAPRGPLAAPSERAFAGGYGTGTNTTALLVVRDGRIVAERYADGFGPRAPQRTWSVAKSIAGTLIGAATARGLIVPTEPAPIPEWRTPGDPRARITTDQLLRMASGLHSSTAGNRTDALYFGGVAVTEEAPFWPLEAPPGTRFRYANNDTLLAIRALRTKADDQRSPMDDRFATDLLFAPMGLTGTIAERDWRGNYMLSSQVWATARDLARFGQLWLDDGMWQGKRLLPAGWMKYMTTPSGPQPEDGPGYGATLWLFGPRQGLPVGSYAAQGNRGQFVMVIPSQRLVIVRRGEDPGRARFDIARFAADVAAAPR